jgi:hypothetical protein
LKPFYIPKPILNCSKHPPPFFQPRYTFSAIFTYCTAFLTIFIVLESFHAIPRVLDHCQPSAASTTCSQAPYRIFEHPDSSTASTHPFSTLFRNFNLHHAFLRVFDCCQRFKGPTKHLHTFTTLSSRFRDPTSAFELKHPFLTPYPISSRFPFLQSLPRVFTRSQRLPTVYEHLDASPNARTRFRDAQHIYTHF